MKKGKVLKLQVTHNYYKTEKAVTKRVMVVVKLANELKFLVKPTHFPDEK